MPGTHRLAALLAALVMALSFAHPANAETPTVRDAKDYALHRLGRHQYVCLDAIATRESHWNPLSHNKTSGAHGIGQALPWTKMKRFGPDAYHNPMTQVTWMIAYVQKYGGACGAWSFWQTHGWY
jgi:hypothetical protein